MQIRCEISPDAPLVQRHVEEVFERTAYHLRIIRLRSSTGVEQTLYTTDEHPVFVVDNGWLDCRALQAGDQLLEPGGGAATVVETHYEQHPEGIPVYNLRVAECHTYFVRAQGTSAQPVWVHNAYNVLDNAEAGHARELKVARQLARENPASTVQREVYLRGASGDRLVDPLTGEARRVDIAVITRGEVSDMAEVTSMTAPKAAQFAKEMRIRELAAPYIRERATGNLLSVGNISTRIIRRT